MVSEVIEQPDHNVALVFLEMLDLLGSVAQVGQVNTIPAHREDTVLAVEGEAGRFRCGTGASQGDQAPDQGVGEFQGNNGGVLGETKAPSLVGRGSG